MAGAAEKGPRQVHAAEGLLAVPRQVATADVDDPVGAIVGLGAATEPGLVGPVPSAPCEPRGAFHYPLIARLRKTDERRQEKG